MCCRCCVESPVGASCDEFVGGCGWWSFDSGLVVDADELRLSPEVFLLDGGLLLMGGLAPLMGLMMMFCGGMVDFSVVGLLL